MMDRGQAYGDGLFETMRAHGGRVPWWDMHWARLARGGERLGIVLPDPAQVHARADELLADSGDAVLKLLVIRGGGARGYAPSADAPSSWQLERHPLPARATAGLRLHWCQTRLAVQPLLAGIKHCNRLEQVLARAECAAADADEGLVRDTEGNVVSATSANLFVFRDGAWWTPPLQRCGVAGTCRAALMAPLRAHEALLDVAAVESADAVFLCNAVRGILPVARIGARSWSSHPAVAATRRVLATLHPGLVPELE